MYEERKTFGLKDIIVQILFVLLFVFVMIWLFPTKGYLDNNYVTKEELDSQIKDSLQVLYGQAFANNMDSMRQAATGYFTNERLPKKTGDSVTLTLGEMLDKKLVTAFKDSNNKACDTTKSFVTVTKMETEYQMKVQLSCSDYSDYIISYIGCYTYCENCGQKPNKPTETTTKPSTDNPKPVSKTYIYEYKKTWQNEWSDWSKFSDWSTKKVSNSNTVHVEIDTRREFAGYESVWGITGYQDKIVYEDKVVYEPKTQKVQVGTITKSVAVGTVTDTKDAKATTTAGTYGAWVYQGYVKENHALSTSVGANSTVKYEYVSDKTTVDCTNVCKNVTTYTYKKYTRSYTAGKTTYSCAAYPGYTLNGTKCVKENTVYEDKTYPVYEDQTVNVPTTKKVPVTKKEAVYGWVNGAAIYKNVTYYRYQTRTLVKKAGSKTVWSKDSNDKALIKDGYKATGNKKVA